MSLRKNAVDNQNTYNRTRLRIVAGGMLASFFSLFLPKKKGRIVLNSHFNEAFDFNSKELFLYLLENGYDAWYVMNDSRRRKTLCAQYGNRFIETRSFRGKLFALRAPLWFVSTFEMPVGGLFLRCGRTIVHLTHGSLVKNVGLMEKNASFVKKIYYRLFVYTNLSYSIATSDFFVPSTASYTGLPQKRILVTGFPRNDALFHPAMEIPDILRDNTFKILYAPTWRKDADVRLFPFDGLDFAELNDFLRENNISIYIRLHPYNEVLLNRDSLHSNIRLFSTAYCKEITDCLQYFDALITDYSSILYDFLLLDRPIMFFPYDYEEYEEKVGFAVDYSVVTPGHKPKTFADLKRALLDMKETDSFKQQRQEVNRLCNAYTDGSSMRLIKTLTEMSLKNKADNHFPNDFDVMQSSLRRTDDN